MSLELIREAIKVNQVIGEDSTQTVVEHDIIVPDVKPDIARVLLLDGEVFVHGAEVVQEKVIVNGVILYKMLYIAEETSHCVKSINTKMPFTCNMEVPFAKHGMKCKTKCMVEHIEHNLLNGRKINVKSIVGVHGKVTNEVEQEFICDLKGIEKIQVLKESVKINSFIGCSEEILMVKETLEVPAGKPALKELLRSDIKITGKDYKITDNKIIAKGELNVSTLYIGDDEDKSIQYMEHEIPFTQLVDLPDAGEDSLCDVEYRITDCDFDIGEDGDGEPRILNSGISLNVYASGVNKRSIDVVEDAYSPRLGMDLDKDPFSMEEVISDSRNQIILKDTLAIKEDSPDIAEIFNVLCKPSLTECRISDDKVLVEGLVQSNILYLANNAEQPVFCSEQEIPFRHGVDVKGAKPGMMCDAVIDIEHCNYSVVSSSEVEIRLVISLNMKVVDKVTFPLAVKVNECPADDKKFTSQPSIIIYFTQPGDNLWKVAKKYGITLDDIKTVNKFTEYDTFNPGQQVIIPRNIL